MNINGSFLEHLPDFVKYADRGNLRKYSYREDETDKDILQDRCLSAIICSGATIILIFLSMTIALLFLRMAEYFSSNVLEIANPLEDSKIEKNSQAQSPFFIKS